MICFKQKLICITAIIIAASAFMMSSPAAEAAPVKVSLPIIMYHRICSDTKAQGKYVISPEEFEEDLRYLKENGYRTVVMQDVIDFVKNGEPLPENPIVLTFDDGYFSDYKFLFPLLKQYDMKAVISIIGECTDRYSQQPAGKKYPHLTWPQVIEMAESGHVEFQNHSYDLHKGRGCLNGTDEQFEDYVVRLRKDLFKLQNRAQEMLGKAPTTMTYPFGSFSELSEKAVKSMGFESSLSCWEGINKLTHGNMNGLFRMKRCIRPHGKYVSQILSEYK